jgi:hypothetical protein
MIIDASSDVRAQLERGRTLPAAWYSDLAVLRLEQERIFKRAWQYVGVAGLGQHFQLLVHDVLSGGDEVDGLPAIASRTS